jgi:prepilin-type N-terminal cleavage/methylation domain-containing protein
MDATRPRSKTVHDLSPSRRLAGRFAFSLIELLIVVAILGILIAVAAPYLSTNVPQQLQMAADSVAGDISYARGLAVANNSTYRITFNIGTNSYVMQHTGATAALNKLPPSPFHTFSADKTEQIAELARLSMLAGSVKIAAVKKNPASPSDVTDLEFGPLGGTTRTEATQVWLCSTSTGTRMYIPVTVNPTTGIVDVGEVQTAQPAGILAAQIVMATVITP